MIQSLRSLTSVQKVTAGIVAALLCVFVISSCSKPTAPALVPQYSAAPVVQPQVVPQAQAPVVVQSSNSGVGDFVTGAAVGAIAGHLLSNRNTQQAPQYQGYTTTAPAQRYVAPPQAQRYISPQTQRQSVTSVRGITTTTTVRPSTFGTTQRQSISVGRTSTPSTSRR